MKTFLSILFLTSITGAYAAAEATIPNPKLPQSGGQATECLKGLLSPQLASGQTIASVNGPFQTQDAQGKDVLYSAYYTFITRLPVAKYRIDLITTDTNWLYYQYESSGNVMTGMYAKELTSATTGFLLKKGSNEAEMQFPLNLEPCKDVLQLGY